MTPIITLSEMIGLGIIALFFGGFALLFALAYIADFIVKVKNKITGWLK